MTAILGLNFFYQIVVIADCRVTFEYPNQKKILQDNLQKIYPLGPTGVIGFSGNVFVAKKIFTLLKNEPLRPLPKSVINIAHEISLIAKEAFNKLPNHRKSDIELMYAAVDYGNIGLIADNVTFAENYFFRMLSPDFQVEVFRDHIQLGYAINYPEELIIRNRNDLINMGLKPHGQKFQRGIIVTTFGNSLANLAPSAVGGLFTACKISTEGILWQPYSMTDDRYQLTIENGKFVQYDHQKNVRVPMESIWDFDTRRPKSGMYLFDTPDY